MKEQMGTICYIEWWMTMHTKNWHITNHFIGTILPVHYTGLLYGNTGKCKTEHNLKVHKVLEQLEENKGKKLLTNFSQSVYWNTDELQE